MLYQSSGGSGYLSDLRFSPHGDRIAFFEHPDSGGGSVEVVDLHAKKRTISSGYSGLEGLAWSKDGREILFSASDRGLPMTVFAVTLAGRKRVALQSAGGQTIRDVNREGRWLTTRDDWRSAVMVHRPGWREDRDFSWLDSSTNIKFSRDASTIVFSEFSPSLGGKGAVCLRRTDGSPVVRLGEGFASEVSPDGKWVLTCASSGVVVQPMGAGAPRELRRGGIESAYYALWFPSGDSILIWGNERTRPSRNFVQDLAGGTPRALTVEGSGLGAITADGSTVIASAPDGHYYRYPSNGGPRRLEPHLTSNDFLFPWDGGGGSVIVVVGPLRNIPLHVEKVDLATGRRALFAEISPANRVGLFFCQITNVAGDSRTYAYDAQWRISSLFLVEPEKRSKMR